MPIHGAQLQKIVADYALHHGDQDPQQIAFGVMKQIQTAKQSVVFGDILVAMDTLSDLAEQQESSGLSGVSLLDRSTSRKPVSVSRPTNQSSLLGLQMKELSTIGARVKMGGDPGLKANLRRTQKLYHQSLALRRERTQSTSKSSSVHSVSSPRLPSTPLPRDGMGLLASMGKQKRIRVYVETGSNKGHQSASVTMAKKLVERFSWKGSNPCTIEFCCNDEDAKQKVQSILGGDNIRGFPCEVRTFDEGKLAPVEYAISGAIDDPDKTFGRLNAKNLIALQPMGWSGGSEVVMSQGSYFGGPKKAVLTKGAGLFSPPVNPKFRPPVDFHRMPFTEPTGTVKPFKPVKAPDVIVSSILDAANESQGKKGAFSVCPLYGMGSGQPMENYGSKVWINMGNALLKMTESDRFTDNIVLTNLSLDMGSNPKKTWGEVKADFKDDPRIAIIDTPMTDPKHLQQITDAMKGGAKVCICTVTGGKDYRVMDRAYRTSRLPPTFEGQGSLTQVLSMGRPFIKLSSRASVDPKWPSDYLPAPSFDGTDVALQKTSNSIIDDWGKAKTDKAQELADAMLDMSDKTSDVSQYFQQCREMVTHPAYDRFSWAAQALANLDELAPHQKDGGK